MRHMIMYTKKGCGWCDRSKELLGLIGLPFEDRLIPTKFTVDDAVKHCGTLTENTINTVPQMILVADDGTETYIGGYARLNALQTEL